MRLARRGNPEKVLACADQTLSARTGQALQASCDVLNSIEEADQVFPGKVVDEQSDGGCNQKSVSSNGGDGKIQKTREYDTKRRQQDRQERAVEAEGQLPTRAERNEENIPETPAVWHDGHGEDDHTLHGDGKVVDIPQNTRTSCVTSGRAMPE